MVRMSLFRTRHWFGIFCAALLGVAGTVLIEQWRVSTIRWRLVKDSVQSDWEAARFAIRPSTNRVGWSYDPSDRGEARSIERLRHIYLVADALGRPLEWSNPYKQLGFPFPPASSSEPRVWEVRSTAGAFHRSRYLLCTGPIRGAHGQRYQLTLGRQLD